MTIHLEAEVTVIFSYKDTQNWTLPWFEHISFVGGWRSESQDHVVGRTYMINKFELMDFTAHRYNVSRFGINLKQLSVKTLLFPILLYIQETLFAPFNDGVMHCFGQA